MNDAKLKEFEVEIEALTKKYGVTASAFTGQHEDQYIGLFIGKMKLTTMFECVLNVGRLWQHMRTTVRDSLAKYET